MSEIRSHLAQLGRDENALVAWLGHAGEALDSLPPSALERALKALTGTSKVA